MLLRSLGALACLSLLLAACAIEGGAPTATPVAIAPTFGPAPTDAAAAAASAARDDTWAIGLLDQPRDLYPYARDAPSQRIAAPLTELLFPSPVLALNYTYTSTGVLDRIPSLENGDAEIRKSDVYLDAANNITTTVTEVITQVDQLVVTFHWNPKLSWSDGQPLTADDSVFAYELARAAPPSDEARDRLAQLVSYERIDDHTTRAILRPDLITPNYFLTYWTPLPRHVLKDVDPAKVRESDFARTPIGYGPYVIERRDNTTIGMIQAIGTVLYVLNSSYCSRKPAQSRRPAPRDPQQPEVEVDLQLKETGQKKTVNGFDTREVVMTITLREKGKTLEQAGGLC